MNHLDVTVCDSPSDASDKGYHYSLPEYSAIEIEKVVVVRNGTEAGNSTVDLVLKDKHGKKFVVMVTGNLIKSIPC
jgi:hypothetical protein